MSAELALHIIDAEPFVSGPAGLAFEGLETMELIELKVARQDAVARIQKQIAEGESILQALAGPHIHQTFENRMVWSDVTGDLLLRLFTETKFHDDFDAEWDAANMYTPQTLHHEISIALEATKGQLLVLRSIQRKIDHMDEPQPTVAGQRKSSTQIPDPHPLIFISHSSRDNEIAEALTELLRIALSLPPRGIRCTSVLAHSLPYGVDTPEALRSELSAAGLMIGLVTPASVESSWVLFEMGGRWGQNKPLFCILAAGADHDQLPGPIRGRHSLKVTGADGVLKFLDDVATTLAHQLLPSWQYSRQLNEFIKVASVASAASE